MPGVYGEPGGGYQDPFNPRPARRRKRHARTGAASLNVGVVPDYQNLILNDPDYVNFRGSQMAESAADRAKRNQGIIQRLIRFGQLPDLTGVDLGDFGIDAATMAQIQANTKGGGSEVAEQARENRFNVDDLQQMLAARGMLRSGSLRVGLGQEQTRYNNKQATTRQDVLNALRALQGGFAEAETGREKDRIGFMGTLGDRIRQANPASSKTAVWDDEAGAYRSDDGAFYDAAGNPTQPRYEYVDDTEDVWRDFAHRRLGRGRY